MSVNDSLNRDINRLVKPGKVQTPLQRVRQAEAIDRVRGRGVPNTNPSSAVNIPTLKREVITVYSHIIVTEDGAFERPPGWPTSGDYPSGWTAPSPLPDSLTLNAGVLALYNQVQYYEQRRVHYTLMEVFTETGDTYVEEHQLYVPLEVPFRGSYFQGITGYTSFYPSLYLAASAAATNAKVGEVRQYLLNQGIGTE